jgi:hypothetical protein
MSAGALEQLLRSAPASKPAPQDVRCLPTQGGWDYVCVYQTDGPQPRTQLKFGVRVSAYGIVQASAPQPLDTPLVSPQPAVDEFDEPNPPLTTNTFTLSSRVGWIGNQPPRPTGSSFKPLEAITI